MKKKIFVRGPVLSQSGYGEQSRFALRALRSREDLFEVYVQPVPWGKTGWIWQDNEFRQWLDSRISETQIGIQQQTLEPDMSLQITIPNEFEKLCPVNIGYTAGIETTSCSPQWLPKCNDMDKIIVVSEHSKFSLVNTVAEAVNNQTGETFPYRCDVPVEVVSENTPRHEPETIDGFELEYENNFLMISQLGPRKNFENAVSWWVEEFVDQEVGLVLKTNFRNNSLGDYVQVEKYLTKLLSKYPDRKCKIYLLHGDLSPGQMTGLYCNDRVKALVNISHGEGFGLPMFEAAREGLPVITVGWSGQLDFLTHNGKDYYQPVRHTLRPVQPQAHWPGVIEKDTMWAFAEQGDYKMTLRRTLKNLDKCQATADELKSIIAERFSDENLYDDFCSAIYESNIVELDDEIIL